MAENDSCSIKVRVIDLVAKFAMIVWGASNIMHGATVAFVISGPFANEALVYVNSTYGSLFVFGVVSFFSTLMAILPLLASAAVAIAVVYFTNSFGHGTDIRWPLLRITILRPLLGGLLLLPLYLWERGKRNTGQDSVS